MLNRQKRFKQAQNVTIFGIITNFFLLFIKGFFGFFGHSQALIADAFHTLSDLFATSVVFLSLKLARKPEDEKHPYGHGKVESIAASIVGSVLIIGGLVILFSALKSIISGDIGKPLNITLAIAGLSVLLKEIMFRVTYSVGKKLDSPAVIASAWDHRSDSYSSIGVFIGIFGAIIGFPVLDALAGGAVSIFIIRIGLKLILESWHQLMDRSVDVEIMKRISIIAESIDGVEHVHELKARQLGQYIVVDLKIEVDSELTIASGHSIAGKVKHGVMEKIPNISDVMVHINPHIAHY